MTDNNKIAFCGGCVTDQDNVDILYHQIIIGQLQKQNISTEKVVVKYHHTYTCYKRLVQAYSERQFDILVFHLRAESVLTRLKLYIKEVDNKHNLRRIINLPFFYNVYSRQQYNQQIHESEPPQSLLSGLKVHLCRNLNYFCGILAGNWFYQMSRYEALIQSVITFCQQKKIKLIITGAISMPDSKIGNQVAKQINRRFEKKNQQLKIPYIKYFGLTDRQGNRLYLPNNTQLNQNGHQLFAELILKELNKTIEQ